jgi:hypothetical protein
MVLIQLGPSPALCRVELDGVDISRRLTGIDVSAHVSTFVTTVTLTLKDDVTVIGEPGRLEFHKPEKPK